MVQECTDTTKENNMKIAKHGLFNTMKVEDAFQYVDSIIETLNPEDKMAAYTATYVLYNSVVDHYDKVVADIDKELDDEQCENATYRDELVELDALREKV